MLTINITFNAVYATTYMSLNLLQQALSLLILYSVI